MMRQQQQQQQQPPQQMPGGAGRGHGGHPGQMQFQMQFPPGFYPQQQRFYPMQQYMMVPGQPYYPQQYGMPAGGYRQFYPGKSPAHLRAV